MRLKDRIIRRMVELAGDPENGWTALGTQYGATVRYTQTHETPEYARTKRPGKQFVMWEGETYESHVFLTLVSGTFIMGTSAAPWVGRTDREVPLWLVEAVLEDPELAHNTARQLKMRAERKAARS